MINHSDISCPGKRPLIIDHDAAVDDFFACLLQLFYAPECVKAITIVPADSYRDPAIMVMRHFNKLFLPPGMDIPIGAGIDAGVNLFPAEWREDAWRLTRLPVLQEDGSLPNISCVEVPTSLDVLSSALSESSVSVDILATGPCTNIAELILKRPDLKNKINSMYIMGGALHVDGNVEQAGFDGSAEWNIYNNPAAFLQVLSSGVNITLVPLDATQYVPIRAEFITQLQKRISQKAFQFIHESLPLIQPLIDRGQYVFWDTLTSAVIINPNIVKTKKVKINVVLDGPSAGKIFEDVMHGYEVDVAVWADRSMFEEIVLAVLSQHE